MGKLNNKTGNGNTNKPTTVTHTTTNPSTPVVQPTTPVCTLVPTVKSTGSKRGSSTIPNPVGTVWVTCFNLCFTKVNGVYTPVNPTPTRNHLQNVCVNMGISFYTTRTQVQMFLKGTQGGKVIPVKLPRGVTLQ